MGQSLTPEDFQQHLETLGSHHGDGVTLASGGQRPRPAVHRMAPQQNSPPQSASCACVQTLPWARLPRLTAGLATSYGLEHRLVRQMARPDFP